MHYFFLLSPPSLCRLSLYVLSVTCIYLLSVFFILYVLYLLSVVCLTLTALSPPSLVELTAQSRIHLEETNFCLEHALCAQVFKLAKGKIHKLSLEP